MKKPEILAPAGSMAALHAAIAAGADAVYLGGSRYGARAYAGNFDENELIEGIRYAHLYGVKVYLTVNTLFRNEELDMLYDYLLPYYVEGLDAVIVQDFGVMKYIHECFPNLPIHASTQMTITTSYAYELLKDYGVTRIVPARELSIDELMKLKDNDTPELEVFVHGALCICYSGQCLMSSYIGGRSGNRGRCAGSCRLPYNIIDADGNTVKVKGNYPLSLKDLCGLDSLTELIACGVDSFKIEGRMKNPEYVAVCVRSYRRCVDYLFDKNPDGDHIVNDMGYKELVKICMDEMAEVFNRNGFTSGYYHKKNGKNMMSTEYPGHMGVVAGVITSIQNNRISVKLYKDVNKGDIFVINNSFDNEITLTSNVESIKDKVITLNAPKANSLKVGMKVYRRFNYLLEKELSGYATDIKKIPVDGVVRLFKNQPIMLSITTVINNRKYEVCCEGGIAEAAASKPVSDETIDEKMRQTGNDYYEFASLKVIVDDNTFIPIGCIKEIRRNAFAMLESEICHTNRRAVVDKMVCINEDKGTDVSCCDDTGFSNYTRILVSNKEQLDVVNSYIRNIDDVSVAVDLQYFAKEDIIGLMHEHPEYGYALPMILRKPECDELLELPIKECSTIIVRNVDELAFLKAHGYKGHVITDYSLYTMNDMVAKFVREKFADLTITLPVESNVRQIEELNYFEACSEWIVYGYQPLMVTAQCFAENTGDCKKGSNPSFILKDRKNQCFFTRSVCKYCYNIIYNGVPTVLLDDNKIMKDYKGTIRLHFTMEDKKEVTDVLDAYYKGVNYKGDYTRGHLNRGVE